MANPKEEAELERHVLLVMERGLSTGHADDMGELLREVLVQVDELRARYRFQVEKNERITGG